MDPHTVGENTLDSVSSVLFHRGINVMAISSPGTTRQHQRKNYRDLIIILSLALVGLAVFNPSIRLLYTMEYVRHYEPFLSGYRSPNISYVQEEASEFGKFRPLSTLLHLGLIHVFGKFPLPYKSILLLIHVMICFTIYHIVRKFTETPVAISTAFLFLLWPFHLQAATMRDMMALERITGLLLILLVYLLWRHDLDHAFSFTSIMAGPLILCSALTKESFVFLPLAFPLVYVYLERNSTCGLGSAYRRLWWVVLFIVVYWFIRLKLVQSYDYGMDPENLTFNSERLIRNILYSGTTLLGLRRGLPPLAIRLISWPLVLVMLFIHDGWRKRGAILAWILLSVGPHLHLPHMGANLIYGALPVICYSIALIIQKAGSLFLRSRLSMAVAWGILFMALGAGTYMISRSISAPWIAVYDAAERITADNHCENGHITVWLDHTSELGGMGRVRFMLAFLLGKKVDQVSCSPLWQFIPDDYIIGDGKTLGLEWKATVSCQNRHHYLDSTKGTSRNDPRSRLSG